MGQPIALLRRVCLPMLPLALLSCGPQTTEDRVHALVETAEAAAEQRQAPRLRALLSPELQGKGGVDREAVMGLVTRYFLTHRTVHVLSRVARIEPSRGGSARAQVYAALAGQPIEPPDSLGRLDADILRLDLELIPDESGELRATRVLWTLATPADMLPSPGAP